MIIIKPGDGARRVGGRGMWASHTTGIALIIVFKPPNILSEEMIILTQARKGALSDDYQLEVTASNDPIFGERPSTLRLSPTCGQQVTR